ncbi:uncharacterized protein LOC117100461 [Anneissia japonica]|uniref:uncharacterized protein LOC117100461 n=1 Tax=Anneissia japonica TaxID=1529436 RepID=UPI0014257D45|nr:uncharacterized protein LOC117100461 [Anneissia japonica]
MLSTSRKQTTVEVTTADRSTFTTQKYRPTTTVGQTTNYATDDGHNMSTLKITSSSRITTQSYTTNEKYNWTTLEIRTGGTSLSKATTESYSTNNEEGTFPTVSNLPCHLRSNNNNNEINAIFAEQNANYEYQEICSQEYRLEVNTATTLRIPGGEYTTTLYLPAHVSPVEVGWINGIIWINHERLKKTYFQCGAGGCDLAVHRRQTLLFSEECTAFVHRAHGP